MCGLLGWYFGRKKAAKERALDEMHEHVMKSARSYSWFLTIATIYILFTLYGVGVSFSVPAALGILMIVQLGSWTISAVFLKMFLSTGKEINSNLFIGISIIILSAILFIILAILTENWSFLFWPIPVSILGIYFIKYSKTQ